MLDVLECVQGEVQEVPRSASGVEHNELAKPFEEALQHALALLAKARARGA